MERLIKKERKSCSNMGNRSMIKLGKEFGDGRGDDGREREN